MLKNSEYLPLSKRNAECVKCEKSLVHHDRHPSVLLDPEEAEKWTALQLQNQPEPIPEDAEAPPQEPEQTQPEETQPEETQSEPEEQTEQPSDDAEQEENVQPADTAKEEKKSPDKEKKSPDKNTGEEPPGFLRLDFCPVCWQDFENTEFFSYWMGRRTESDLPPKKLNREERNLALLALFDSLSDREDEENDFTPHRFFLAHLLMKYKIFKWQPSVPDPETGHPLLRFHRTDAEEEVQIPEIEMPAEAIVKIKEEIEGYLEQSTGQVIRL